MIEPAAVVLFVLRRPNEDMPVPFVGEISHVGNREVHALVFRALNERRKAVVIFPHVDELPMVFAAYRFQVIDILCLECPLIFAGVTARRKFMGKILFEFFDFSHCIHPP